jgi:hypothetical protein
MTGELHPGLSTTDGTELTAVAAVRAVIDPSVAHRLAPSAWATAEDPRAHPLLPVTAREGAIASALGTG